VGLALEVAKTLQWSKRLQPAAEWIDGLAAIAMAERARRQNETIF
jgi:hypothetical protein